MRSSARTARVAHHYAASLAAAGLAPSAKPSISIDLAAADSDQTSAILVEVGVDDALSVRSVLSEPINSNRNPADTEALRAAQARRERKVARQAKGYR